MKPFKLNRSNLRKIKSLIILSSIVYLFAGCTVECTRCSGSGQQTEQYVTKNDCRSCNGNGATTCNYSFTNNGFMSSTTYQCSGGYYEKVGGSGYNTGLLAGDKCTNCNGKGYLYCNSCNGEGFHETAKKRNIDCSKCDI